MTLAERIQGLKTNSKRTQRWTFTLEPGQGQTYAHGRPVLYGHNTYPRGSVLAGQPERLWLKGWDTWEQARTELTTMGLKYDDHGCDGGTTHIPVEILTAGLPDEPD